MAAVGYETALTRYFAVAKWSEYGYWVISIVMVGFALSGVVLALFRDAFARHGERLLAVLPSLLVVTAAGGYLLTAANPFNPLQLQNPATWQPQIWNIAGYYLALLPFFFLAGVFVSLSFVLNARRIGRVYGYDLTGAGAGAASVLVAMFAVHAFNLVALLLLPLAASALFVAPPRRLRASLAAGAALILAEAVLLLGNPASFNEFKAVYAPLNTPGASVLAEIRSPRGDYLLLDDFTERVDTDVSNNAGMMGVAGPPQTYGLYRDGNRIAALPKPGPLDVSYARAALDALPYELIPQARVLLAGASGGYRIAEIQALGAAKVRAMEPEPVLADALANGLGPSPGLPIDPLARVTDESPVAGGHGVYDVLDISADFLDAADGNATAFTADAIAGYLRGLAPGGIVSIPVSIRDFPVYAVRMLATVRLGLMQAGVSDPPAHVIVYRSAWNVRILLSREPWDAKQIALVRSFCDDRSFDVSWYPGMDVAAARANIYNDLPAVSFATGEVSSDGSDDAIADEAEAVLRGEASPSRASFNLAPVTLDRPFFYAVLRLDQIGMILKRLEILPQAEVGGAGQPGGAGAGGGDRHHRAAGAAGSPGPAARDGQCLPVAGGGVFSRAGSRIPVHRDFPDREGQPVAERPDQWVRPGADRHAGVLRPWQHAGGPAAHRAAAWHRDRRAGGAGLDRRRAGRPAAADHGDAERTVADARGDGAGRGRAGVAGAGAAVPPGPRPHR